MKRNAILTVILWGLLCGCEPSYIYEDYNEMNSMVQLAQGLVTKDTQSGALNLLRIRPNSVTYTELFSPEDGKFIDEFFPGHEAEKSNRLFVLSAVKDDRRTDVFSSLAVIDVATGATVSYTLGSRFSQYRFSPDGQTLILFHGDSDSNRGSLSNPNEIAIVDLSAPPLDANAATATASVSNPRTLSVNVQGHTIEGIHFLDPFLIGNAETALVAFVTVGAIHFTNMYEKTLPTVAVSLKNDTDSRRILARKFEVLPGTQTRGPRVFVQADGASELYDIEFNFKDNDAGFYATTSLLDGGSMPSDFAVLEDAGELFVVSASSSQNRINIFEASTAHITTLTTNDRIQTIFAREQDGQTELVMYGNGSSRIYFLQAAGLGKEMGDNLDAMILPDGMGSAVALDDDRLMIYPDESDLAIADLRTRTITHLTGENSTDWQDNLLWGNTLFLPGHSKVEYLNILNGTTGYVALDEPLDEFYVFEALGLGMALHATPTGRVTTFPLATPTRAHCKVYDGFLVSGILNRGEE